MYLLNKLKNIKNEYRRKKYMSQLRKKCDLPDDSIYASGFNVQIRKPIEEKVFLSAGHKCVLAGSYIFETETGHISIGNRVHIGASTFICKSEIIIEDDVTMAWGCTVYDHNSHSIFWEERKNDTLKEYENLLSGKNSIDNKEWSNVKTSPIRICSKAWIGMNAIILKGVTIGEGAVVGAGSVVTKDVPPWTVVCGNPAKVVKYIEDKA